MVTYYSNSLSLFVGSYVSLGEKQGPPYGRGCKSRIYIYFLPRSLSLGLLTSTIESSAPEFESLVSYLKKQGQFRISGGSDGGGCGTQYPLGVVSAVLAEFPKGQVVAVSLYYGLA